MGKHVVSAKVDDDVYRDFLRACGDNGVSPNEKLNDLIRNGLENHDKLTHPEKFHLTQKAEKLEIIPPEEEEIKLDGDEEMSADEFYTEIRDSFREWEKERGYTYVKTDTLKKVLDVLQKKKGKPSEETTYVCPGCKYEATKKFKFCPECGEEVEWETEEKR